MGGRTADGSEFADWFAARDGSQATPRPVHTRASCGLRDAQVASVDIVADEADGAVRHQNRHAAGVTALRRENAEILVAEVTRLGTDRRVGRENRIEHAERRRTIDPVDAASAATLVPAT